MELIEVITDLQEKVDRALSDADCLGIDVEIYNDFETLKVIAQGGHGEIKQFEESV